MKHIFWAHSPIGYEVYRSFKDNSLVTKSNSLLITARNFHPTDADYSLGLPEEYLWMNEDQFNSAKDKIIDLITQCQNEGYILYIPQTANFFIRCMIESPLCIGYHVFDEGSAARAPAFESRVNLKEFYKYSLRGESELNNFFNFLAIDFDLINQIYSSGVPFYDTSHCKFLGFMSHFKDSFPGNNVTPIVRAKASGKSICSEYALLLMPPYHVYFKDVDFKNKFENLVNSIQTIKSLNKKLSIVIKFHPHDSDDIKRKLSDFFNAIPFNEFCENNNISKHQEPAFMGFKLYIGYPNSTISFLKEIGGDYIAF